MFDSKLERERDKWERSGGWFKIAETWWIFLITTMVGFVIFPDQWYLVLLGAGAFLVFVFSFAKFRRHKIKVLNGKIAAGS